MAPGNCISIGRKENNKIFIWSNDKFVIKSLTSWEITRTKTKRTLKCRAITAPPRKHLPYCTRNMERNFSYFPSHIATMGPSRGSACCLSWAHWPNPQRPAKHGGQRGVGAARGRFKIQLQRALPVVWPIIPLWFSSALELLSKVAVWWP